MPEGDSIFKAARTLNRALAGQTVTGFRTELVHLARVDDDQPIAGRTIERVEAKGKHLLINFSGGLVMRTHAHERVVAHLSARRALAAPTIGHAHRPRDA